MARYKEVHKSRNFQPILPTKYFSITQFLKWNGSYFCFDLTDVWIPLNRIIIMQKIKKNLDLPTWPALYSLLFRKGIRNHIFATKIDHKRNLFESKCSRYYNTFRNRVNLHLNHCDEWQKKKNTQIRERWRFVIA